MRGLPVIAGLVLGLGLAAPVLRALEPPETTPPRQEGEIVLGGPSRLSLSPSPGGSMLLAAGTRLRQEPDPYAPVLEVLDAEADLPVLDRRPGWLKVRYGSRTGWVEDPGAQGPSRDAVRRRRADPERLERALAIFPFAVEPRSLGPYVLYTDSPQDRLLRRLNALVEAVEAAYRREFGNLDSSPPGESIVLFATEAEYRAYEAHESAISGAGALGHAGYGMAVLFSGERSLSETAGLLGHELTHLLNQRCLPALPPWLEEGMAEHLGMAELDRKGLLRVDTLRGERTLSTTTERDASGAPVVVTRFRLSGPKARLARLLEARKRGTAPPLEPLTGLAPVEFLDPERRELLGTESGLLVRFLLHGGEPAWAQALRAHLEALSRGAPEDAGDLPAVLDTTWTRLESAFHLWLAAEARRHAVVYPPADGRSGR